ncbi:hypothetical protein HK096_010963 [Nowakowskiella sp. JEL0078]|nr:hypothetical protein HK096_010963 [Nowakowskiella sp. JEL0078]
MSVEGPFPMQTSVIFNDFSLNDFAATSSVSSSVVYPQISDPPSCNSQNSHQLINSAHNQQHSFMDSQYSTDLSTNRKNTNNSTCSNSFSRREFPAGPVTHAVPQMSSVELWSRNKLSNFHQPPTSLNQISSSAYPQHNQDGYFQVKIAESPLPTPPMAYVDAPAMLSQIPSTTTYTTTTYVPVTVSVDPSYISDPVFYQTDSAHVKSNSANPGFDGMNVIATTWAVSPSVYSMPQQYQHIQAPQQQQLNPFVVQNQQNTFIQPMNQIIVAQNNCSTLSNPHNLNQFPYSPTPQQYGIQQFPQCRPGTLQYSEMDASSQYVQNRLPFSPQSEQMLRASPDSLITFEIPSPVSLASYPDESNTTNQPLNRCACGKLFHNPILFRDHCRSVHGFDPIITTTPSSQPVEYINVYQQDNCSQSYAVSPYGSVVAGPPQSVHPSLVYNYVTGTLPGIPQANMMERERAFRCDKCEKTFLRRHDLKRHMLTHLENGQKPFECAQCGVTFTRQDAMQRHIKAERCKNAKWRNAA